MESYIIDIYVLFPIFWLYCHSIGFLWFHEIFRRDPPVGLDQ